MQARYRIKSLIEPHERVDPDYLEDVDEWRRDEPATSPVPRRCGGDAGVGVEGPESSL